MKKIGLFVFAFLFLFTLQPKFADTGVILEEDYFYIDRVTDYLIKTRVVYTKQLTNDPNSQYPLSRKEVSKITKIDIQELNDNIDLVENRLEEYIKSKQNGKLTLTLSAISYKIGDERQLYTDVTAVWDIGSYNFIFPSNFYDYIAQSTPEEYTMISSSFGSPAILGEYKTGTSNHKVVWNYQPTYEPRKVLPRATLITTSRKMDTTQVSEEKVISYYVHSWDKEPINFSLDDSNSSISISTTKNSWKLSIESFAKNNDSVYQ